jgi:hypothetical protein
MNTTKFVNDLIREAFTSGDRANTTPNSNGLADAGGTARQMLSGEWLGSPAWPFDQATSKDFKKSSKLQLDQSKKGQGELVTSGLNAMESAGTDIVNSLLEDSPAYLYSDPTTLGYFLEALNESGYTEEAKTIQEVCENPTEENVELLVSIAEKFNESDADPYFAESLVSLIEFITEEDATDDAEEELDDKSQDDKASDKEA